MKLVTSFLSYPPWAMVRTNIPRAMRPVSAAHHMTWRRKRRLGNAIVCISTLSTVLHAAEAGTTAHSEIDTCAMRIPMPGSAVTTPHPQKDVPKLARRVGSAMSQWRGPEANVFIVVACSQGWRRPPVSAFNTLAQRFWRRLNRWATRVADAAAATGMGTSKLLAIFREARLTWYRNLAEQGVRPQWA
jgi:hypothetical protein